MKSPKDFNQEIAELGKYYRGRWELCAKDPEVWYQYANSLKTATVALRKVLWRKDRERFSFLIDIADSLYGPVYMLLAGLSVETLLKGIIVATNPELVEKQKLSKDLTHHNLAKLYKKAGFVMSNDVNNLLSRLQNYVEIFGRYPVTKTKHDMQKLTKASFNGQTDPDRIDQLWNLLAKKIRPYIQESIKKGR
jgi:hypothetical protein